MLGVVRGSLDSFVQKIIIQSELVVVRKVIDINFFLLKFVKLIKFLVNKKLESFDLKISIDVVYSTELRDVGFIILNFLIKILNFIEDIDFDDEFLVNVMRRQRQDFLRLEDS